MNSWKNQLREFDSLLRNLVERQKKGEGELRFNRHFIAVSDIAEQYFCEKKVEMQHIHGKVEKKEKILGTEAHEKLLEGTMKIHRRELWKKIFDQKPVVTAEMLLLAKCEDVVLVGIADSVLFVHGEPWIIFEYKFSRIQVPFRSHHVQARVYGLLLKNMGFDTSRLFYAIVIVNPRAKDDEKLKHRVYEALLENGPKEAVLTTEDAKIYLNRFVSRDAESDVEWAIEFWKKRREAIATINPNKCRSCEFNEQCKKTSQPAHLM